ncbi:MAG: hypothetical protein II404_07200 [Prevotella sp.]|nr:hypothetical protein [Prevotella sp.]
MIREDNDKTYLSDHFTLQELTATNAKDKDGKRLPNVPPYNALKNLQRLARDYLEKLRKDLGDVPVIINSAYRSPAVNQAVGGSPTSLHQQGLAADINCGKSLLKAVDIIHFIDKRYLKDSNFPYHELFLCYKPKTQTYWVHLSFKETAYQNALNCKLLLYK